VTAHDDVAQRWPIILVIYTNGHDRADLAMQAGDPPAKHLDKIQEPEAVIDRLLADAGTLVPRPNPACRRNYADIGKAPGT